MIPQMPEMMVSGLTGIPPNKSGNDFKKGKN
jgi:hypothetical protein